MNELAAKSQEIQRLHAVCRAKNDAVRQAYRLEVARARAAHHRYLQARRSRAHQQNQQAYLDVRDEYLYAARVLHTLLEELEGWRGDA